MGLNKDSFSENLVLVRPKYIYVIEYVDLLDGSRKLVRDEDGRTLSFDNYVAADTYDNLPHGYYQVIKLRAHIEDKK